LFTACAIVNKFWDDLSDWAEFLPVLSPFEKLYGHIVTSEKPLLINQVMLVARQCIYVSKCNGKVPTLNHFKNMLKVTMCLEKIIALQRDRLDFHLDKWEPITNMV
jgi:hypothetical protein